MDEYFAFAFALVAIIGLKRVAPKLGLVDKPNDRKTHHGHVPLVGGLAIFLSYIALYFVFGLEYPKSGILLALSSVLVLVSIIDDRKHVPHKLRLVIESVVALAMAVMAGVQIVDFGYLTGNFVALGIMSIPVTVFATVGVINAMNFTDGMDGLSGGLAFITIAFMAYMSHSTSASCTHFLELSLVLIFVFLLFNARWTGRSRAAVFLGDAGSVLLGFVIAWFLVELSQGDSRAFRPVTALWFFAVPLIDTVATILRRLGKGRSPFAPDREHFHHVLNRLGMNDNLTVILIYLFAVISGFVGVIGEKYQWPESTMFYSFLTLFFVHYFVLTHAWRTMRVIKTVFAVK